MGSPKNPDVPTNEPQRRVFTFKLPHAKSVQNELVTVSQVNIDNSPQVNEIIEKDPPKRRGRKPKSSRETSDADKNTVSASSSCSSICQLGND